MSIDRIWMILIFINFAAAMILISFELGQKSSGKIRTVTIEKHYEVNDTETKLVKQFINYDDGE